MFKVLRSKKGEGYIDVCVSILVIMMVLVIAMNVFSFLTLKIDMDYFAQEMVDIAALHGTTSSDELQSRYDALCDEVGFEPDVAWEADYIYDSNVQYGDPIEVKLTYQASIQGLGAVKLPVTLTTYYSGLSRNYWKQPQVE